MATSDKNDKRTNLNEHEISDFQINSEHKIFQELTKHNESDIIQSLNKNDFKFKNKTSIILSDKSKYKGDLYNKIPDGRGTQKYKNGDTFQGYYLMGKKHGLGELKTEKFIYFGNFENDKVSGFGNMDYKNGDKYVGNFSNGLYDGKGKLVKNGKVFNGIFNNGNYIGEEFY